MQADMFTEDYYRARKYTYVLHNNSVRSSNSSRAPISTRGHNFQIQVLSSSTKYLAHLAHSTTTTQLKPTIVSRAAGENLMLYVMQSTSSHAEYNYEYSFGAK